MTADYKSIESDVKQLALLSTTEELEIDIAPDERHKYFVILDVAWQALSTPDAVTRCTKVCECPPNDTPLSVQRFFERTKEDAKAKGAAALTEHARLALSIQEHLRALSAVQPQRPSALQRCVPAVHGFGLRQSPGPIQDIINGRERIAPRPSELFALLRAKVQQLL